MTWQPLLLALWLWCSGRLEPRFDTDSGTYLNVALAPLRAALADVRTLGYPLFLRGVEAVFGDLAATACCQLAAHVLGVWLFYAGLRRVRLASLHAAAAASGVLWGKAAFEFVPVLLPDSLALSLAVAAVGLLLRVLGEPRSAVAWMGLVATSAAAYHVRPAYLFLLPLLPLLGATLLQFRLVAGVPDGWRIVPISSGLVAAVAVPFLAWCGLRWVTVGHFGLVSFGGYNLIGITGQFVDEELTRELTGEWRAFAQQILERRREVPGWEPPVDYYAMERMYNGTVWTICVPAARDLAHEDPVRVNKLLNGLSAEVVARRPAAYLKWLRWGLREGVAAILWLSVINKATLACLGLLVVCEVVELVRGSAAGPGATIDIEAWDAALRARQELFVTATGFALAVLLLVVLVEIPNHRYMTPASVFVPGLLAALSVERAARTQHQLSRHVP